MLIRFALRQLPGSSSQKSVSQVRRLSVAQDGPKTKSKVTPKSPKKPSEVSKVAQKSAEKVLPSKDQPKVSANVAKAPKIALATPSKAKSTTKEAKHLSKASKPSADLVFKCPQCSYVHESKSVIKLVSVLSNELRQCYIYIMRTRSYKEISMLNFAPRWN